ncbi:C-C motif chemokine 16 [Camelus dromedarius]|uniref:C-C motif chemokine 16 n=3 Tax=Camelidae TaxID=9835 RepID=A0A8B6Y8A5_CAMFR|nr:C-C motif chemokine 16 [Camelus ferus]XP_006219273.2 C-C motif chemokine 16 [Vicugna pacos]XP_010947468.1 C-C motif chemokine 16 [Camelus bactrianus]XP_010988806.1 C-C motif chemokine 16 [Camelus dromedarius]
MKFSVAALFLLILIFTTSAVHSQPKVPDGVNLPPTCCVKYHEKVLPRKLVVGYKKALSCHLPAIIFVTKKNRQICANPNLKWVQDYIADPTVPLQPSRRSA